jgi:plasmid stabilization system protein ParE
MGNSSIFWTKTAIKQFEAAIIFIASGLSVSAEKVAAAILKELNKTSKNAEFFPPDKYKKNNDGSYRAFEKCHYRVAYRIKNNVIRVLRVRHTKMSPKEY